jgi:hypothetical protein
MRRDSPLAIEISAALTAGGGRFSSRRIESWTIDGLGPEDGLFLHEQMAHYRELQKLSGPGRGRNANLTARRMAAHGFVCRCLRRALLHGFNIPEIAEPETPLDLSTEESTDEAFARLDEIARDMSESIGSVPAPLRWMVETLRRKAYESAKRSGEPGEVVFRSMIVQIMYLLFGGEVYDAEPIAAILGVGVSRIEDDAVEFVNENLRITTWDIDEAFRTLPLADVARMAVWLRERAHLAVEFLGLESATESQLDDLAALFAPFVLHLLGIVRSVIDDAEEFIADLGLPDGLVVPAIPDTPLPRQR